MVYPILSLYLQALGAGPAILGVIEGIAESTASITKVFSGAISDRLGKRKAIAIIGYSLSTLGKVLLFIAGGWVPVLLGRTADRFGKGIRTAPRDALIVESITEDKKGRAFGIHRTLDTLGAVIGIILSIFIVTSLEGAVEGTFAVSSYLPSFKFIIGVSVIPAIIGVSFLFFTKDVDVAKTKNKSLFSIGSLKSLDRGLKAFLLISLIFTLGNSSNQFILRRASELGYGAAGVIVLYLIFNLSYMVLSYPAGRLSDRIGRKRLIVTGYLIYGAVYFILAFWKGPGFLWMIFVLYGIYMGLTEGVSKALIADLAPRHLKGTFMGLHATIVGVGLLPASLITGFLWERFSYQLAFSFGGATGVISALLLGLLIIE
jgi:MFS family permease